MTLVFTNKELLQLRGLPADTEVVNAGPTTGSERGKFDGVFIEIEGDNEDEK